jgi:hypothetical protein
VLPATAGRASALLPDHPPSASRTACPLRSSAHATTTTPDKLMCRAVRAVRREAARLGSATSRRRAGLEAAAAELAARRAEHMGHFPTAMRYQARTRTHTHTHGHMHTHAQASLQACSGGSGLGRDADGGCSRWQPL